MLLSNFLSPSYPDLGSWPFHFRLRSSFVPDGPYLSEDQASFLWSFRPGSYLSFYSPPVIYPSFYQILRLSLHHGTSFADATGCPGYGHLWRRSWWCKLALCVSFHLGTSLRDTQELFASCLLPHIIFIESLSIVSDWTYLKDTPNLIDNSETVHISSLALLKMLRHGRAGVPMEVMGLMLGEFVDEYTVRVVDVFAMPQSGTGVSVEAVDPVFQTKMMDMLRQTGRYGRWRIMFSIL